MTKLYAAFGSNLNKKQMRLRCPTARPLGKFMLNSAQLVFRGVADLEFVPGASTPCGLWALNKEDEKSLDRYEGVSSGAYFKSEEITIKYLGRPRRLLLYLMRSDAIYPPSQRYVDTIRKGYQDFELKESFLDDAIARSFVDKRPDVETLARRARQRNSREQRDLVTMPASSKALVKPAPGAAVPTTSRAVYQPSRQLDLPELTPERTYEPDEPSLPDDPKFGDGDGGWYFDPEQGWRLNAGRKQA